MTYFGLINYEKCTEWKLGKTTVHLMPVFADLEGWATAVPSNDTNDQRPFYLLYREKILSDIPYLGSVSSISRSISELESKGIIECANKYNAPAYRLTAKGLSWKRKPEPSEKTNDGETAPTPKTPKETKPPKKQNKYVLAHKERFEFLNKEYVADLFAACIKMATDKNIPNPKERFEEFAEHHSKHGNKFSNWRMAFGTWLRKYEKFNKPKGGEFAPEGLYQ